MGRESVIHDVSEALAYSPLGSVLEISAPLLKKQPQTHDIKTPKSGRMKSYDFLNFTLFFLNTVKINNSEYASAS